MKQFQALFRSHADDFRVYLSVLFFPFLAVHLILFGVMAIFHPQDTPLFANFMLTFLLSMVAFLSAFSHMTVSFSQYISFGCNRKRALTLAFGVSALQTACCTLFTILLSLAEPELTLSLCRRLSGNPVDPAFHLPVEFWVYPLAALGALVLGLIAAAVLLRFGRVGGWVLYGVFMAVCFAPQYLPWESYTITDWLWPLLLIVAAAALIWSIHTLLHLSIS